MSIGNAWRELARQHGERTAIIDDAGAWSYRQLASAHLSASATRCAASACEQGDRVALLVPDIREYLEADYGIMCGRAGAGAARSARDRAGSRRRCFGHAGARRWSPMPRSRKGGRSAREVEACAMSSSSAARTAGSTTRTLLARASDRPLPPADGDDLATLNFSGGTTGAPKAAMLRQRNLLAVGAQRHRRFRDHRGRPFPQCAPALADRAGHPDVASPGGRDGDPAAGFDPERLARAGRARPVPPARRWCRPSSCAASIICVRAMRGSRALQAIYVGGSRIPPDVFARALDLIGPRIGVLYGLTEAPVTCYLPPRALADEAPARGSCIGRSRAAGL